MACMEHSCVDCDWYVFNNTRGPSVCPLCGGAVRHNFDEPAERDAQDYPEYENEDRDNGEE